MAACKTTVDTSGVRDVVKIPTGSLPVTAHLHNPPLGVKIAAIQLKLKDASTPDPTIVSADGKTFQIPVLPKGTKGTFSLRYVGNANGQPVAVAEDCDNPGDDWMTILDTNSKAADVDMEVV